MFKFAPAVFAVNMEYQIMVRVDYSSLMWVKVGDKCYHDDSNGILRSDTRIHKMTVPGPELEKAGKYIICERKIIERKPYFSETEEVREYEYDFYPIKSGNVKAYHIADAHNQTEAPIKAAQAYGDFDFLILNGDIPDHCGNIENFDNIYEICGKLTHGSKPVVFSRGNHDMRGIHAEAFADYTPVANGKSYYTVRLGGLWAIILDCGEDKEDSNAEYGNTICCHNFRLCETEYIKSVIENADKEYNANGVTHKAVIVHAPFPRKKKAPFDIEAEIYSEWCDLLRTEIKPDIMICGHEHILDIEYPGCDTERFAQPCTIVLASQTDYKQYFAGSGFEFSDECIKVSFTDSNGDILNSYDVHM